MKQIIQSVLVMGMGAAWLYVFAAMGVRGSFYAQEPSTAILLAETLLFAAITGFGIWMFTEDVMTREKKHPHKKPRK